MFFHKYKSPAVMLALGLAGLAHAQSNVSLYGTIDLAFGSFQLSGTPGSANNAHLTKVDSNQMTTSFIGFKGSEDLGGGLKAGFAIESFLRPDTGASGRYGSSDTFWSRAANVYLQSDLGKLTIGRQINLPYLQIATFNPFGGAFGLSPAVRLTYGSPWGNDKGDSGWSNAVSYNSPVMGGFSGTVQVQTGESSTKAERTSYGLGGSYSNGPFAAAVSWQMLRSAEAPKTDFTKGQRQTFGLANVSYDAGFAKFFGQYGQIENHGFTGASQIFTSLYQVGASVPVTASGKVLASYGQSKEKPVDGGTTPMTIHGILTVAYDYNLSKRTDTYAAVMMDNESLSGYKTGYSYVLGLRHSF